MIDFKKNFLNILDDEINDLELISSSTASFEEAREYLNKYRKTSQREIKMASSIEDYKYNKYTNNIEIVSGKIHYDKKLIDLVPNDFVIVKKNNRVLYELNFFAQSGITSYKLKDEFYTYMSNKNSKVIKETTQMWMEQFHIFNFNSYYREDKGWLIGEKYVCGFPLTTSSLIRTGSPLEGGIILRSIVFDSPIEVNYSNGKKEYHRDFAVERDINKELVKVLDKCKLK